MSEALRKNIEIIVKQSGGRLTDEVKQEFIQLCQQHFNYRPDMTCGKCIYKHAVKLYDKYFK